ncbi:MAG: SusE domain-containing protein [Prevotellaceae bacterium]|jgi:hypothetical protein|nr:SusE domain-containing protein [Prevotellaceae bacterium]
MKKMKFTLAMRIPVVVCAAAMFFLSACSDDDNGKKPEPKTGITLIEPNDGWAIYLTDGENTTFRWESSVAIDRYQLQFSASEDFTAVETLETAEKTLTLPAGEFNDLMANLNVPETGEHHPVWWTVRPADATVNVNSEVWMLKVTRFETPPPPPPPTPPATVTLIKPANGDSFDMNVPDDVTFEWSVDPAGAPVKGLIGQQPDLSDMQEVNIGTNPSPYTVPGTMAALLLAGYGEAGQTYTLYYTIIAADANLQPGTEIRSISVTLKN